MMRLIQWMGGAIIIGILALVLSHQLTAQKS